MPFYSGCDAHFNTAVASKIDRGMAVFVPQ
jgi:hypothetical protein